VIHNIAYSYLSVRAKEGGMFMFYCYLCNLFIPWFLVGYVSKNIIFDSFLYNILLILSGVATFAFMGQATEFTMINWAGLITIIIGFILIKL
jgi:hypothetical protein